MSTTTKSTKKNHSFVPNYIKLLPPGEVLEDKIFEMGIDVTELAQRMEMPEKTIRQLLKAEIPLTPELATKIEQVTWMSADSLMMLEQGYRNKLEYVKQHPEMSVY
ncbi:MAG: hypothetical protein LBQ50_01115 [Planctomycetaceae bacterium]|jgi:addiction module HigA family antidote|nr:hypothetical protein [Planctomycetaceae bacterium]